MRAVKRAIAYLRRNLVFRVSIVYAAIAYVILQIVKFAVSSSWLPDSSIRITEILAIIYFLLSLNCASVIQLVSLADRTVFLKQILWVHGPAQLLYGPIFLALVSLFYESLSEVILNWKFLVMEMLLFVAAIAWMLMSARVARAWARERAQNPELLALVELRFIGPMNQHDLEVRISRKTYYMFLASIAAFIIFILETFASEFLDDNFSVPGYFGALVAAIIITAFIYPIHKRALWFIASVNALEEGAEASIENPVLAVSEVADATARYFKSDLPQGWGRLGVFAAILVFILLAVVKLYPYFNG